MLWSLPPDALECVFSYLGRERDAAASQLVVACKGLRSQVVNRDIATKLAPVKIEPEMEVRAAEVQSQRGNNNAGKKRSQHHDVKNPID